MIEIIQLINNINLSGKSFDHWQFDFNTFKNELINKSTTLKNKDYILLKEKAYLLTKELIKNEKNKNKMDAYYKILSTIEQETKYSFGNHIKSKEAQNLKEIINEIKETDYYNFVVSNNIVITNKTIKKEFAIKKIIFLIAKGIQHKIEEFKKQNNYIEQEDLHIQVIKLLENDHDLKNKLQTNYNFFLLDEFQDTNWLQNKILSLLHKKNKNHIFIVGDLKQSIYRFQQCDNQIFQNFMNDDNIKYLTFKDNYRSEKEIVEFNNYYFSKNNNYKNFNLFNLSGKNKPEFATPTKNNAIPPKITFSQICYEKDNYEKLSISELNHITKIQEAKYICNTITTNTNIDYSKWGILIRSYTNIDYLIETFKKYNIPYSFVMKKGLFNLKEIMEFINILKIIAGIKLHLELDYIDNILTLIESIASNNIKNKGILFTTMYILNSEIYQKHLMKFLNYNQKMENLRQLLNIIYDGVSTIGDDFLEIIYYLNKLQEYNNKGILSNNDNAIKIMTIYSAKGLEFDNVFIINIGNKDYKNMNLIKFINLVNKTKNHIDFTVKGYKDIIGNDKELFWTAELTKNINNDFEEKESANLLYVALTRAKKNIFVTLLKNSLPSKPPDNNSSSQWLKNINQNLFDKIFKYNESGHKTLKLKNPDLNINLNKILIEAIDFLNINETKNTIVTEKQFNYIPNKAKKISSVTTEIKNNKNEEHRYSEDSKNPNARELGNFVHKFFEENTLNIHKNTFIFSNEFDNFCSFYPEIQDSIKTAAKKIIKSAINNNHYFNLLKNEKEIYCEQNLLLREEGDNFDHLEAIIDLLIIKDSKIIILDYKTHYSQEEISKKFIITISKTIKSL